VSVLANKSRLDCEIELIYTLFKKTVEMNEKNVPIQVKNTHDPEKWKKKFVMVFNREKVIDFTGNNFFPFELKQITGKPKACSKEGKKILTSNARFWVIFVRILPEKLIN